MQIDKGIPITGTARYNFPFDELEIGDSFAVSVGQSGALRMAATRFKKDSTNGWDYTTRVQGDKIRLWRVA